MKLLSRLLSRLVFVRAELADEGVFRTEVYLWQRKNLVPVEWDVAKGSPVIVIVCGHGVVTKPDNSQVAERVKSDSETFLWSAADGNTSFVRRERIGGLEDELSTRKIVPVKICCANTDADFAAAVTGCAARFLAELRWRDLWRPTDACSSVAQALARRAALPVLGCFLALLAGNMFLSQRLNARKQLLQTQYAARERTVSDAAQTDARQRQLLETFGARPTISRAVVCDRIAGVVPEKVVLTSLDIEPLTARFEAGKPLQRRDATVFVCGLAATAVDISEFTQRLGAAFGAVRLAGVEKERDGKRLVFQIELGL